MEIYSLIRANINPKRYRVSADHKCHKVDLYLLTQKDTGSQPIRKVQVDLYLPKRCRVSANHKSLFVPVNPKRYRVSANHKGDKVDLYLLTLKGAGSQQIIKITKLICTC